MAGNAARDVGVHSLDHFGLGVPDVADAQKFYGGFGLDTRAEGGGLGLYGQGATHRWGVVQPAARKHLAWLSFGCYEQDLEALAARMKARGVDRASAPTGAPQGGLWFHDMDGTPVHIGVMDKSAPDAKPARTLTSSPAGTRGTGGRSKAPKVHPTRLSHVLRFTPDVSRALAFYEDVLGMRLSDRTDMVAFMHGIHGSDHHMLAFAQSAGPGLHHCSWDMGSIDEIGIGAARMADKGYTRGWGLGRHVLGSNYFHYVQDPWGSFAEYSADIDYVAARQSWPGAYHKPEDSLSLWGPNPPDYFIVNHEAMN